MFYDLQTVSSEIVFLVCFISFCILVFASWCVGEGGEILGQKYDASIIGGLVIAWLNKAPETIFFITALQSNNPKFAIGAVSGSTIVVCTVALGTCIYIGATIRKTGTIKLQEPVKRQCMYLGLSTLITVLIPIFQFNIIIGLLGIIFYIAFLISSLQGKVIQGEKIEDIEANIEEQEEKHEEVSISKGIGYLIIGGGLICIISSTFIESVVIIASILKVTPTLLAFFLAPIASEAPEILESISLSRKGNTQNINIAFSNLVGGTITKTTLLSGIFCLFGVYKGFTWESPTYSISFALVIVSASTAAGIGYFSRYQRKVHGIVLFILFIITGMTQYYFNTGFTA